MRVTLALLLAASAFGQCIEIRYSRQGDEIVKSLIGVLPKTVALYRADVVNTCATEARMFPSRVGFEAAATAPMQDPEAALYAAQHFKDTRWWVVTLKGAAEVAKYAGPAALGLATAGVAVPAIVTGLAGGIGGGAVILDSYRKDASTLKVPATWLRDGLPEIILRPGEPVPYLLVLGGNPPGTFKAVVASQPQITPGAIGLECNGILCANGLITLTSVSVLSTHPQIEDDDEREILAEERLSRMLGHQRNPGIGAGN